MSATLRCLLPLVLAVLGTAACSIHKPDMYEADPDTRLGLLLAALQQNRADGTGCDDLWQENRPTLDCQRIRVEIDRLALEFPRNPRILMAAAVVSFAVGDRIAAQQHADAVLDVVPIHPEAAILRSRLAIQEGNLQRAERLLVQQVRAAPDHPGLREALAAVRFLQGRMGEAAAAMDVASALGGPPWRVAYHRGLLAEARGSMAEARVLFAEALELNPAFDAARARLVGLDLGVGMPTRATGRR